MIGRSIALCDVRGYDSYIGVIVEELKRYPGFFIVEYTNSEEQTVPLVVSRDDVVRYQEEGFPIQFYPIE
jgi:hypothetical protein